MTFTASNGIPVAITDGFTGSPTLVTWNENGVAPVVLRDPQRVQALREFFRAEEDERLGRWRWPENPDYVVYVQSHEDHAADVQIIRESDGRVGAWKREWTYDDRFDGDFAPVARAYFDAHPQPKPWHDAKAGEVWVIRLRDEEEHDERAVLVETVDDTFVFQIPDGESITTTREIVVAGRRIWPEATS